MHVVQGVADVVHARPALADALRDQAGAAVQVQLPYVRGVARIRDEG
jgi:hypothetical protein